MNITTQRLILRDLKLSDAKDIKKNIDDIEVSKWLARIKFPYRLKYATQWIKELEKTRTKRKKSKIVFGIELKAEKSIIGSINVHKINHENLTAEISYWLGKNYHNQGIGKEAIGKVLDYIFTKTKIRRLDATVKTDNPGSWKLLDHFGFKREGLKREAGYSKATKKIHDIYIYGLLKRDYKKLM